MLVALAEMSVAAGVRRRRAPRMSGARPCRSGGRIDPQLLEILVCPLTKAPLSTTPRQELVSRAARLAYPIRDGIPIMLVEEARSLDDAEKAALSGKP